MQLSAPVQRCLDQFVESQSRLAIYHCGAIREIQSGLRGCLLLDRGLCSQATKCAEAAKTVSDELAQARLGLLFSGRGAAADLTTCFAGEVDEALLESLRCQRVPASGGLLWLEHSPQLADSQAVLVRRRRHHLERQPDDARHRPRQFVDWIAALQWLANAEATVSSDEDDSELVDCAEYDDFLDDWELQVNCPGLEKLQLVLAPLLTLATRRRLRRFMLGCALFLQRLSSDDGADIAEHEITEAVEHGVLLSFEESRASVALRQSQLRFAVDADAAPDFIETTRRLVDAGLRDFVPSVEERRRRLLVDGDWQLGGVLSDQLIQLQRDSLRQLLSSLIDLIKSARGVLVKRRAADFSGEEQRRPLNCFDGDLKRLRESAEAASRSFQRSFETRIGRLSTEIEAYLRQQEVKDRLAAAYAEHSLRNPHLGKQELQQSLMEQISKELHQWNRKTQIISQLDRSIAESRVEYLRTLRQQAQAIPELIVFGGNADSFCGPTQFPAEASSESLSTNQMMVSVGIRQLRLQPMRPSLAQRLAVGIGMPLFVPLVFITVAIIAPVSAIRSPRSRRDSKPNNKRQSVERLRDEAWDYLDNLSSRYINDNFFVPTRRFLQEDALELRNFIDRHCILPETESQQRQLDPARQLGELENLYARFQGLVADAKLYGALQLGDGMLTPDRCRQLGIDAQVTQVESAALLGEQLGGSNFSEVFALPRQQEQQLQPLAVKLIRANATRSGLLEAEMLRELAGDPHPSLLPGLGCLHFPRLGRIGLLMPRCRGNLRQLLNRHRASLVPAAAADKFAALAACLRLYQQILDGVRHLHSLRILHRDLKLENVLTDDVDEQSEAAGQSHVCICDFGFAKSEEALSGESFVGTHGYLAPELTPPRPQFSIKSDVFALGIMLWECYYGTSAPVSVHEFSPALLDGDKGVDFVIRLMTHRSALERPHVEQCIAMLKLRQRAEDQVRLVSYMDSLSNRF